MVSSDRGYKYWKMSKVTEGKQVSKWLTIWQAWCSVSSERTNRTKMKGTADGRQSTATINSVFFYWRQQEAKESAEMWMVSVVLPRRNQVNVWHRRLRWWHVCTVARRATFSFAHSRLYGRRACVSHCRLPERGTTEERFSLRHFAVKHGPVKLSIALEIGPHQRSSSGSSANQTQQACFATKATSARKEGHVTERKHRKQKSCTLAVKQHHMNKSLASSGSANLKGDLYFCYLWY